MSSVLVVDDEPRMREILVRWLAPAGYITREAPDADAAIDSLTSHLSDVVFCDIQMPGHDGLWLVAQLRERFPGVAIVLATGVDSVPPVVSMQGGVVEYLLKPFERGRVLEAVKRAIEWQQTRAARGSVSGAGADPLKDWLEADDDGPATRAK
ncbi:MAG TPA: response regulator [Vicinamibacterales bacterium]|jgi:DNA-binding NtrC family response regulator